MKEKTPQPGLDDQAAMNSEVGLIQPDLQEVSSGRPGNIDLIGIYHSGAHTHAQAQFQLCGDREGGAEQDKQWENPFHSKKFLGTDWRKYARIYAENGIIVIFRTASGRMEAKHTSFAGSFPSESQCPAGEKPEYAFIGRSNVGKSSLINMLTGRKNIAHTSRTPGKTQLINYYLVNGEWYLVDLPGYGYARISKTKRRQWRKMIEGYLQKRLTLQCAFVLIDANIPPQEKDISFINWLGESRIPFVIVYTKTDRLKPPEVEENIKKIQEALLQHWQELPRQFITSSIKGEGREEILQFINEVNEQYFKAL